MDKKKFTSQVLAAIFFYTLFSCILEKDYSTEAIFSELKEGVIFGVIYAVIIWFWYRYKKKT
ncbi:hypothetical protein [uncultured Eudoraea sp.]|uniref:hypothetical protein n=1 Tax=uncultured Eudoraea sp. TaxID=1035614 RepID=UPI002633F3A7|nr:hypothetical protein [uncultured Eudoraea sp.]